MTSLTLQYSRTISLLDTEAQHMVGAEITGLADRYNAGGVFELKRFVDARAQSGEPRDFVYAVADPRFKVIAGDLSSWPRDMRHDGWNRVTVPLQSGGKTVEHDIEARIVRLNDSGRLLVGHLASGRARLRERFIETLIWSIGLTALIGLGLGWLISRRALRFVGRVSDTGERFLAGGLDERLPTTGRGDEYDRLAETVNACFSEVERMVASLRAATDGLAHDLKTPITRIKARIELATLREAPIDPSILLETSHDLDALLKLINDLLGLARTEALTAEAFERVDLAEVAKEAVNLYEPVAESEGCRLVGHTQPAVVEGVRPLLMQAVVNLIDNALKYGGAAANVGVWTETCNGRVILSVTDDGPGIDQDDYKRAVARLTRLDASRTTPGSGLGLSIVSAVARAHGGTLSLHDNRPGLKVIINLPAVAGSGATPTAQTAAV
ncbi:MULTISPECIES: sensor histidine kinase [Pseudomonadota]|uniref:sensor histidine kinase n=1 Tax=Pseudomonadota TaxID=1224 RepID=UPI001428D00E|nr:MULTISPECIES: HAMP domain-containing sensor histidine kinase [Pseudomonadota]